MFSQPLPPGDLAALLVRLLCDVQNKIRTWGLLREQILSLPPLTGLGYLAPDSFSSEKTIGEQGNQIWILDDSTQGVNRNPRSASEGV